MDNQQTTRELSWLAGFIEADGSLYFSVQLQKYGDLKITPTVTGVGCEETLIERCSMILQTYCQVNPYRLSFEGKGNKRLAHRFVVSQQAKVVRVLEALREYLYGRKKEIANLILEFCHSRMNTHAEGNGRPYSKRELEIAQRVFQLNSVGVSETKRKSVERINLALQKI